MPYAFWLRLPHKSAGCGLLKWAQREAKQVVRSIKTAEGEIIHSEHAPSSYFDWLIARFYSL